LGHQDTGQALAPGGHPARAALIAAGVVLALVTAVTVAKFLAGDFKDAAVWYDAGRRVLEGRSLAGLPHYRYPPTFAVLIAPLCALGWPAFFFIWYGLNVGLFGLSVGLTRALVRRAEDRPSGRLLWLPPLLVAVFAINNLFLGQTNLLIMALVYWFLLELARGREWLAGAPLGAAIAIKAFPAPLLAYLAFRLHLRAAAAALASCAFFLLLLPAPVRGLARNQREVAHWAERVVMPYLSRGRAGDWGQHSVDIGNHSLPAVARRLLMRVDAGVAARRGEPLYVNFADLPERHVNLLVLGAFAALGAAFVGACGLRRPPDPGAQLLEHSLAVVLVLLTSALAWTYFFVMLLLPITTALWLLGSPARTRAPARRTLRAALVMLVAAIVLLYPAARPTQLVRAAGSLCWATLALFAGLALARRDLRHAELRR